MEKILKELKDIKKNYEFMRKMKLVEVKLIKDILMEIKSIKLKMEEK